MKPSSSERVLPYLLFSAAILGAYANSLWNDLIYDDVLQSTHDCLPVIHYNLAVAYATVGRFDEAETVLVQAPALDPADADTANLLNYVRGRRHRSDTISKDYQQRGPSADAKARDQ